MTDFTSDLKAVIASFESIAKLKSPFERRFHLCKVANFHGIPKAEFRKLFELWLVERGGEA